MLRAALLASLAAVAGSFSVQAAEVGDTFETSASVVSSCSMTLTHPIGTLKYDPVGVNASQDSTTNHLPFSGGGQTFGRLRVVYNRQAGIMVSVGEGLNPSPGSTCDAPCATCGRLLGHCCLTVLAELPILPPLPGWDAVRATNTS